MTAHSLGKGRLILGEIGGLRLSPQWSQLQWFEGVMNPESERKWASYLWNAPPPPQAPDPNHLTNRQSWNSFRLSRTKQLVPEEFNYDFCCKLAAWNQHDADIPLLAWDGFPLARQAYSHSYIKVTTLLGWLGGSGSHFGETCFGRRGYFDPLV